MTILVVMGVSGSGKTTIAERIAASRHWALLEGDAFHPPVNVAKMAAGTPLTDEDRWPWLHAIAAAIDSHRTRGESAVVACSALRRAYRDFLIGKRTGVRLIYLRGDQAFIAARLRTRAGHFMPVSLLESQFRTLEEPGPDENPVIVDTGGEPDDIAAAILEQIT